MKKLLLILVSAFVAFGASAQESKKPTIAVWISPLDGISFNPLTVPVIKYLQGDYVVVGRDGEFQQLVDKEYLYQSTGRVDDKQLAESGKQFGVDYICAIIVDEFNQEGSQQYYFQSRIISVENACVEAIADATARQLTIEDLRKIGGELVKGLKGEPIITVPVEPKRKTSNLNMLKPIYAGFELRFLSSFSSAGIVGLGFHFNRSYFKCGFDVTIGSPAQYGTSDYWPKGYRSLYHYHDIPSDYQKGLTTNIYLLSHEGLTWEFVSPTCVKMAASPGLNFKYFSLECGLGVSLCKHLVLVARAADSVDYEANQSIKPYFMIRPTVTGYIPVDRESKFISISLGYNFVPALKQTNCFVAALGINFEI